MPPFLPRKRAASSEREGQRRRSRRIASNTVVVASATATVSASAAGSTIDKIKESLSSDSSPLSSMSSSVSMEQEDSKIIEHNKRGHSLKKAKRHESKIGEEGDSDDDEEEGEQMKHHEKAQEEAREGDGGKDVGENEDEEDDEEWEDAVTPLTPLPAQLPSFHNIKDIEVTLDSPKTYADSVSKKGPTKSEREARIGTHCLHVQCLLYHNAIRNVWINDKEVQAILFNQLPDGIREQISRWKTACGLQPPPKQSRKTRSKGGGKGKSKREVENRSQTTDLSHGDPTIQLLSVLAAYWKSKFKITAPGLRKRGYRPLPVLDKELQSFRSGDPEKMSHFPRGEKVDSRLSFRELARKCEGSRDVGAQLFTALTRSIGIDSRMVASLQPIGFGWSKAENYDLRDTGEESHDDYNYDDGGDNDGQIVISDNNSGDDHNPSESKSRKARVKGRSKPIDSDLAFPIYWTEAISPVTHAVIPVECLVLKTLPHYVATTPELVSAFEPRGARAEQAKQIIAYVVAYSADRTAKDVTTRYLKRRTWPGKTKGFRIPVEKIPIAIPGGPTRYVSVDWFDVIMRRWMRPVRDQTAADKKEEAEDLVPNQPERKAMEEGDTLQSLRSSPEFVLERFLHREEALRPDAKPVRLYVSGKGAKAKEEKVYKRSDVLKCMSAETWRREGRQIKLGEVPLKRVPIRAVTLTRKREVEEYEREFGERQLQGLYAEHQTEYIIPPPIQDGVIPKNSYGNIDCFVPSMVPDGATHLPYRGTVRVCKKLGIDYAEAVTGFEFGSKMAVPVITGVVVASENAEAVLEAWHEEERRREEKERLKHEKDILTTWRKLIMAARIIQRIRGEYAAADHRDEANPFTRQRYGSSATGTAAQSSRERSAGEDIEAEASGGGFILSDEDEPDVVFYITRLSFALVNLKPLVPGHVLVCPIRRIPRFTDLTPDETADLFLTVRHVSRMIERHYQASSLNIAIQDGIDAGQSVPHVHAHIIPRKKGDLDDQGGSDAIYGMMNGTDGNIGRHQWEAMDARRASFPSVDNDAREPRSMEDMHEEALMLAKEMEKEEKDDKNNKL
ncbi:hypothetical protein KEM54_005554 [Ascosphaera aggregata]|nr:hypothetical protein KEM54_005554 [Ascosphaera aggregata]